MSQIKILNINDGYMVDQQRNLTGLHHRNIVEICAKFEIAPPETSETMTKTTYMDICKRQTIEMMHDTQFTFFNEVNRAIPVEELGARLSVEELGARLSAMNSININIITYGKNLFYLLYYIAYVLNDKDNSILANTIIFLDNHTYSNHLIDLEYNRLIGQRIQENKDFFKTDSEDIIARLKGLLALNDDELMGPFLGLLDERSNLDVLDRRHLGIGIEFVRKYINIFISAIIHLNRELINYNELFIKANNFVETLNILCHNNLFFYIPQHFFEYLFYRSNIFFASCSHRLGTGIGGKRGLINLFYELHVNPNPENRYSNFSLILDDNITTITTFTKGTKHRDCIEKYICVETNRENRDDSYRKCIVRNLISIFSLYSNLVDIINRTPELQDDLLFGIYKGGAPGEESFKLDPTSYTNSNKIYKLLILNVKILKKINQDNPTLYYCPFACSALEDVIYNNHFSQFLKVGSKIFDHYYLRFAHRKGEYTPDFNECLPLCSVLTMPNIPGSEPIYFMLAQYIIIMIQNSFAAIDFNLDDVLEIKICDQNIITSKSSGKYAVYHAILIMYLLCYYGFTLGPNKLYISGIIETKDRRSTKYNARSKDRLPIFFRFCMNRIYNFIPENHTNIWIKSDYYERYMVLLNCENELCFDVGRNLKTFFYKCFTEKKPNKTRQNKFDMLIGNFEIIDPEQTFLKYIFTEKNTDRIIEIDEKSRHVVTSKKGVKRERSRDSDGDSDGYKKYYYKYLKYKQKYLNLKNKLNE